MIMIHEWLIVMNARKSDSECSEREWSSEQKYTNYVHNHLLEILNNDKQSQDKHIDLDLDYNYNWIPLIHMMMHHDDDFIQKFSWNKPLHVHLLLYTALPFSSVNLLCRSMCITICITYFIRPKYSLLFVSLLLIWVGSAPLFMRHQPIIGSAVQASVATG